MKIRGWFYREFWTDYVLAPYDCIRDGDRWRSLASYAAWKRGQKWSWPGWSVIWCRLLGHPAGEIFYSSGLEPDTRCAECLEHLS